MWRIHGDVQYYNRTNTLFEVFNVFNSSIKYPIKIHKLKIKYIIK